MANPIKDGPFKEAFPPSSGSGDEALEGKADGAVTGAGQFVLGHVVEGAPESLFEYLRSLDSKA